MKSLVIVLKLFLLFTVLTGVVYPAMITVVSQIFFYDKANGSLVTSNHQTVGSSLIGQKFSEDRYFMSRPSAISYNPLPSGGSNDGLTRDSLRRQVEIRRKEFVLKNHLGPLTTVPSDMLFASGSGLDPHISPESAVLQIKRVAQSRHFNAQQQHSLELLVQQLIDPPQFSFLGQNRINVFMLNLLTDTIK